MDDLLAQLRDIRGIGEVPWWPLAPGWWAAFAALALFLLAGFRMYRRYRKRQAVSWKAEIKSVLADLRIEPDGRKQVTALSEILRQLAIRRYGRARCAGLEGQAWLEWLTKNDPAGFDWQKNASFLIEAPYAPDVRISVNEIEPVIKAVERWAK